MCRRRRRPKNNTLRLAHFSVHFFAVTALHDYDMKFPRATIYRGRKHKTTKFFFVLNLGSFLKNSVPVTFTYIWYFKRVIIVATKFEKSKVF